MTAENRKRLGKMFKDGATPYYENYYNEFKKEIDEELKPKTEVEKK